MGKITTFKDFKDVVNENNNKNLISDVINNVHTKNEILTSENYAVLQYDGEKDEAKLLEIATTLPRALYHREFFRKDKNDQNIFIIKILDDDELIINELNIESKK